MGGDPELRTICNKLVHVKRSSLPALLQRVSISRIMIEPSSDSFVRLVLNRPCILQPHAVEVDRAAIIARDFMK